MKCKICGHITRTINAMRIHYLKKHPAAMKRKKKEHRLPRRDLTVLPKGKFCPHCGAKL